MRNFWWITLVGGIIAVALGIALWVQQENEIETATRGWELATENENLPLRNENIAGINVELTQYDTEALDAQLSQIAGLGFTWVRQSFYWEIIEPNQGEWQWETYDAIVEAMADYPTLQLVAVLDGTPAWARDTLSPEHPFSPPASAAQYGEFTRAVADRYSEQIDYYQLWDEPNLRSHWGNTDPKPAIYTAMIRAAYPQIHQADADAQVILAALAPNVEQGPANYNENSYLSAIYEHGGQDYFDAVAAKPYGYNVDPYNRTVEGDFNFSRIILMRENMVTHGDGDKPIWGSNFGWNHLPADWQGPPSIWGQVSAEDQITFTQQAFERARNEWPWLYGLVLHHWQPDASTDNPIQGFAVAPNIEQWASVVPHVEALIPGFYDVQNPYTVFDGEWQLGPLGADALPIDATRPDATQLENRVDITFYGTDFGLRVRRYDVITGYYIILIDGEPANTLPQNRQGEAQIVLKATGEGEALDLIVAATGLEEGIHTATILHRPRQGDDAWAFAGIAVAVAPTNSTNDQLQTVAYALIGFGLLLTLISVWKAPWRTLKLPSQQSLQNLFDLSLTLGFSFVFLVGSALTWGEAFTAFFRRDPPALILSMATVGIAFLSPIAILSIVFLVLFALIVFNRPLMGLLAILFWSMFFSSNVDAYIRLISVVEAMLMISLFAISGRGLYEWSKKYREQNTKISLNTILQSIDNTLANLHGIDVGVITFLVLSLISISWAELRPEAIHELRLMILGPVLFYALLRLHPFTTEGLFLVTDTLILGGTIVAGLGLFNFVTGDVILAEEGSRRLVAVYGSPNAVALHLGRILPFAVAYVLLMPSGWRKLAGGVTTGIIALAFLLTQSLGGLLFGLPIASIVFLIFWKRQQAWKYIAGLAGAGLAALLPLSLIIPRLRNITSLADSSSFIRINVWRSTAELIADYPLRGIGLDQFLYAYRSRYILPEASADPNLSHPHNIVLEHWVRFGLLGVVLLIWIQVYFWKTVLSIYRQLPPDNALLAPLMGIIGSMAYILGHGLIDASLVFINLSYMYITLLVLVLIIKTQSSKMI